MLIVGLTGGVGSGKTLAAHFFAELGVAIVDTDLLAREVVELNTPGYKAIVDHFGSIILQVDKTIDRHKLKQIVFHDPKERLWLENTIHPLIRELTKKRVAAISAPYCIVVIPLLAEKWPHPLINRVLVVDISPELQIKRLIERDNCTAELAQKMISAQATRDERLGLADDVIDNNGDVDSLREQVLTLHRFYLANTPPPSVTS